MFKPSTLIRQRKTCCIISNIFWLRSSHQQSDKIQGKVYVGVQSHWRALHIHTHTYIQIYKTQRRTALFWVITQRSCPEMSVRNYHYSLRSNPEERSPHLFRGGILKSRKMQRYWIQFLCKIKLSTSLFNMYLLYSFFTFIFVII